MPSVAAIARLFSGWNTLFSNSSWIPTTVTTLHILGLLGAGGLAVAADRMTLRASVSEATRVSHEIRDVHRPVLLALVLLFVTGVALATADIETFLGSPVFWVKLGLVGLLLLNGLGLARAEGRLSAAAETDVATWRRLRGHAWASLLLWIATTIVGSVLVKAA
jgi:uncharacterized membrane protein